MKIFNQRGYILLSVVFLTLITSFMAVIILNANVKVQQHNSGLRMTAIYIANEQIAEIESLAAKGNLQSSNYNFLGVTDDLISYNHMKSGDEKVKPVEFSVTTKVSGIDELKNVEVIVSWSVDNKPFSVKMEKVVHVNRQE